jgi:long-chain fatty acid transport protein
MLPGRTQLPRFFALALLALAWSALPVRAQYGLDLTGAGPVNRSMGGASVAAPLDGVGAIFWNPATTTALPNLEMDLGVELLYGQSRLSSSLPANAFGPGIPPIGLAGSDRGDNGIFPLPAMALVYRPEESPWTYGVGVFAVAGFGVNYPASNSNPILTPQPPNGVGLGSLFSELQVIQIAPTVALQVSDRLSVGVGPALDLAVLRADPLFVVAPNANGNFATGAHSRYSWGGGVQAGIYYLLDENWRLGASLKSPQWFEDFHFQSTNAKGGPRNVTFNTDLPMIASVGVAYAGFERWLLAADFRYVDFANTNGFRHSGFDATGTVRGLGWDSIFAMALGAQYQLTDCVSLRLGYTYNQNPIDDSQSSFNVASSTILEHTLYVGASYKVSDLLTLSFAYAHGFENSIDGPLVTPFGPVPGSSVKSTVSADTFLLGATVHFGCKGSELPVHE